MCNTALSPTPSPNHNPPLIMIINWKWKYGIDRINQSSKALNQQIADLALPALKIFEAQSDFTNTARIVATNFYKDENLEASILFQHLTKALLEKPEYKGARIYLFLHEGHQQTVADIDNILENKAIEKCFFFSSGRDFIYYSLHKKGFLNDVGRFWNVRGETETCKLGVNERGEFQLDAVSYIKKPYFDDVWHYYQHEFKIKLFELKHDLIGLLAPHTLPDQPAEMKYDEFAEQFKKDEKNQEKNILLRLKSFLGVYDLYNKQKKLTKHTYLNYQQDKEEVDYLKEFEKSTRRSYLFDDLNSNLTHQLKEQAPAIALVYSALKSDIQKMLGNILGIPDSKPPTMVSKSDIRNIRRLFRELIDGLPGDET